MITVKQNQFYGDPQVSDTPDALVDSEHRGLKPAPPLGEKTTSKHLQSAKASCFRLSMEYFAEVSTLEHGFVVCLTMGRSAHFSRKIKAMMRDLSGAIGLYTPHKSP